MRAHRACERNPQMNDLTLRGLLRPFGSFADSTELAEVPLTLCAARPYDRLDLTRVFGPLSISSERRKHNGFDQKPLVYCWISGALGARMSGGAAGSPFFANGNSIRTRAANIATELSFHRPPCSKMISFGTRTTQQGTRAFPV